MKAQEEILVIETDPEGEGPEQLLSSVETPPVELRREVPEAWQHVFWQPDVWLLDKVFAADLVALLLPHKTET